MHLRRYPATLAARLPRRTVRLRLTALYGALFLLSGTALLAITNILARGWPWPPFSVTSNVGGPERQVQTGPPSAGTRNVLAELAHQHAAERSQLLAGSAIALGVMAVASMALGWFVAGRVLRPLRQMTAAARAISEDNLHERLAVPGPGDELKDLGDTIDGLLDRLQSAFDAQRNFAASASHELRTPLTLTHTLLQMALTDPHPTLASYKAICQDILQASEHQEQLIAALLTLARSQRGLEQREPLDLAAITRDVLKAREADATEASLAIRASMSTAPVLGDRRLLEQLAANLIGNAIRHNTHGGWADIQITNDAGHPRLKIINTGPVIPPDEVPRLLQPFQRLSSTRTANDDGLGLGLPIIAAIAKAHHATLNIKPGPRGGLNIDIRFPPATSTAHVRLADPRHRMTGAASPSPENSPDGPALRR